MLKFLLSLFVLVAALKAAASCDLDVPLSELYSSQRQQIPRPLNPPHSGHLAYQFRGHPPLCINHPNTANAAAAVSSSCVGGCFTVSSSVRLDARTPGTLMSIAFPRSKFDITFRRNTEVRVFYSGPGYFSYNQRFLYQFNTDRWYNLGVTICPTLRRIMMYVNCNLIYSEVIPREMMCEANTTQAEFCIGGRNSPRAGFQGAIQNMRVSCGDYPTTCDRNVQCAGGETRTDVLREQVSSLQATVSVMQQELTSCVAARMQCQYEGHTVKHGYTWQNGCEFCICRNTTVICTQRICPRVSCSDDQVMEPANAAGGKCCATCRAKAAAEMPNSCLYENKYYFHGSAMPGYSNDIYHCYPCSCQHRHRRCIATACSTPSCPADEQYRPMGTCCKTCVGHNKCRDMQPCGPRHYAQCTNMPNNTYKCGTTCRNGGVKNSKGLCEAPPRVQEAPQTLSDFLSILG